MKKLQIPDALSRSFNKTVLQIKKHSPEILVVAGVVGTVASAVMACKATLKVNEIVDETKYTIDKIHEAKERGYTDAGEEYTAEDNKKDLALTYVQTGVKFAKLYGPSVALGALSITSILSSNNILRKRNVALAAAYTAVDKGFKEYRGRVIERFGQEVDRELKYNIKAKEVEETVVNEKGKEKKVKKKVEMVGVTSDDYNVFFFDELSPCWEPNADLNLCFLRAEQNFANERLKARGHLFLNDILVRLGLPKTPAGQVVGWVYNPERPNGDNYIDFGFQNVNREATRNFMKGYEPSVMLEFNVDGNIHQLMSSKEYYNNFTAL